MRLFTYFLCFAFVLGDALPEIPADIGPQTAKELATLGMCLTGLVMLWYGGRGETRMWIRKGTVPFEAFQTWWRKKGVKLEYQDPNDPDNNFVLNRDQSEVEAILNQ